MNFFLKDRINIDYDKTRRNVLVLVIKKYKIQIRVKIGNDHFNWPEKHSRLKKSYLIQ